jgi:hypothetical protein
VGYVTSGGIGHSTNEGRAIGMGYRQLLEQSFLSSDRAPSGLSLGERCPSLSERLSSGRYVRCDDGPASKARLMASSYELEVGGKRVPATPSWSCLYDPKSERPRSDLAA